jgi:hypothetical protein
MSSAAAGSTPHTDEDCDHDFELAYAAARKLTNVKIVQGMAYGGRVKVNRMWYNAAFPSLLHECGRILWKSVKEWPVDGMNAIESEWHALPPNSHLDLTVLSNPDYQVLSRESIHIVSWKPHETDKKATPPRAPHKGHLSEAEVKDIHHWIESNLEPNPTDTIDADIVRRNQFRTYRVQVALHGHILTSLVDLVFQYYHVPDLTVLEAIDWFFQRYRRGDDTCLHGAQSHASRFCHPTKTRVVHNEFYDTRLPVCYDFQFKTEKNRLIVNREYFGFNSGDVPRQCTLNLESLIRPFRCPRKENTQSTTGSSVYTATFEIVKAWVRFLILVAFLHPDWSTCQLFVNTISTDPDVCAIEKLVELLQCTECSSQDTVFSVIRTTRGLEPETCTLMEHIDPLITESAHSTEKPTG